MNPIRSCGKRHAWCRICKPDSIKPALWCSSHNGLVGDESELIGNGKYRRCKACAIRLAEIRRIERRTILAGLKNRPCMDCLNRYPPECMDFDHRPGEVKLFEVSGEMVRLGNMEAIMAEIAKCDLVCANCHRVRTMERLAFNV